MPFLQGKKICLQTISDNTSAVAWLWKGSRNPVVNSIVKKIWLLCFSKNIEILKPKWIASRYNNQADWASRIVDIEDWTVSDETWEKITDVFGTPEIDYFASTLNTRCKIFHSRWYQPNTTAVNTFTTYWVQHYMFWTSPIRLIPAVLQKIKEENEHGTAH